MKAYTVNDFGAHRPTLVVTVKLSRRLRWRIKLGLALVRCGAWIMGTDFALEEAGDDAV